MRTPPPVVVPPIAVAEPPPKPAQTPAPARFPLPIEEPAADDARGGGDSSFAMALIAIILAGVGLGLSQVPFGRFVTVVLAAIGLVVGGLALLIAERGRLWPAVSTLANAVALLLITLLPSWLGLESWWPAPIDDDPNQVKAVAFEGGKLSQPAADGDWIDASKLSWQRRDVRVTVFEVRIGPVRLKGPKEKLKDTKEKYILIGLRVRNSGVARMFEYRTWNAKPATPESPVVKLTDSAGKELKPAVFDDGWDVPGRGESASLRPTMSVDDILVFEAPKEAIEHLKLELPFEFGDPAPPVRLLIPKAMIR